MFEEIKTFIAPCVFMWRPPAVERLEQIYTHALGSYFVVFWVLQSLFTSPAEGLLATVVEMFLILAFTSGLTALVGKRQAFRLILAILLGSTSVVGLLAVPASIWLLLVESGRQRLVFYTLLLFPLWWLAVLEHIFHRFLEKSRTFCFWLACGYATATYLATFLIIL